jgi:hypothetical protein
MQPKTLAKQTTEAARAKKMNVEDLINQFAKMEAMKADFP